MLVGAMNPCPCGYHGTGTIPCICTEIQVRRYAARISGPLLDRIDLHVRVPALASHEVSSAEPGEASESIRVRVDVARDRQLRRYRDEPAILSNAELGVREVRRFCAVEAAAEDTIRNAVRVLGLSTRAYHRVLRLARTIADLDASDTLRKRHVAEAILYRTLDRNMFAGRPQHV